MISELAGSLTPVSTLHLGKYWWDAYPDRYTDELARLDAARIRYHRDEGYWAAGILRLDLYPVVDGGVGSEGIHIVATFPDLYPFFRFDIAAPELSLEHHQHPFSKGLCVLPRATGHWLPGSDRLATFITDRLPQVITTATTSDTHAGAAEEEHQAEPFSDYYDYSVRPEAIIIVDGSWSIPSDVAGGTLLLGQLPPQPGTPFPLVRACVLEVRDIVGRVIENAPVSWSERFPVLGAIAWIRSESVIAEASPRDLYRSARGMSRNLGVPPLHSISIAAHKVPGTLDGYAILFPEEVRWRGQADAIADGWVFAMRAELDAKRARSYRPDVAADGGTWPLAPTFYFARVQRGGPSDVALRTPDLTPLADAVVLEIGLGCIGAPSALEFARAGVGRMTMIDDDVVDVGTLRRWPHGFASAGRLKVVDIMKTIHSNYPYTEVIHPPIGRIGGIQMGSNGAAPADATSERAVLDNLASRATLIYDATAESGVQQFLSYLAALYGIHYVGVDGTAGGWGGTVVRIRPGVTRGCRMCVDRWRDEGVIISPPADPTGLGLQPEGCANPTFTGAGFDLQEIALMGVRGAIGAMLDTLAAKNSAAANAAQSMVSGPRSGRWDVAVLALRDQDGNVIAPRWTSYVLAPHPSCACSDGDGTSPILL